MKTEDTTGSTHLLSFALALSLIMRALEAVYILVKNHRRWLDLLAPSLGLGLRSGKFGWLH